MQADEALQEGARLNGGVVDGLEPLAQLGKQARNGVIQPIRLLPGEVWLRIGRRANDYIVEAGPDGQTWSQIRFDRLHEDDGQSPVPFGLYACSPKEAGYVAEIAALRIEPDRAR